MLLAQFTHDYVKKQLESFTCPITGEYFKDPVFYTVNNVKQIFERSAIEQWRAKSSVCPLTQCDISGVELTPCSEDFKEHLKFLQNFFLDQKGQLKSRRTVERLLLKSYSAHKEYIIKQFLSAVKSKDIHQVDIFEPVLSELINETDGDSWAAIHFIVARGDFNMLTHLLKYKPSLDKQTESGMTPLDWAISANHPHIVEFLLKSGIQFKNKGNEELELACSKNIWHRTRHDKDLARIIKLLFAYGAQITNQANTSYVLYYAIRKYYPVPILQMLLDNGADINARDDDGNTALHYAASIKENEQIVSYLLKNNANPGIVNDKGETPRHNIAIFKHDDPNPYRRLYKKTVDLLKYYESEHSRDIQSLKIQEQAKEIKRLQEQLKEEQLKREMLEKKQVQFEQFKQNYQQSYNKANFFKQKSASMKEKLSSNEISSIDEVQKYANDHPDSRTAKIIASNHATQDGQKETFTMG